MPAPPLKTIRLEDYRPSAFLIPEVELDVTLHEDHTRVAARLRIERNPAVAAERAPLVLDGAGLVLESVALDGRALRSAGYDLDDERLTIHDAPDACLLETICQIRPQDNTALMGFYASRNGCFTQCEPEGFRRITFFIDRPDVMARYTTTLRADATRYPVLLANGNRVAAGVEAPAEPGAAPLHWAQWVDPFPKPSYLFAMVAARLEVLEDSFVTRSGRSARLAIYVEPGKLDQAGFAMQALKKAMAWDERTYGLELDLDQYMIVAVGDFNMGAMENKGLNIFNTRFVLARSDTATDADYQNIDRVIAHEYFHNWTGNRVTCRDWFQLSLKEGLTVFRDQEFCADTYSRAVQRIRDVRNLRARQFPEDAGPMAHPVRPRSYVEISNFYTATVYEKGAEVVRMIRTLIGRENFRRGMDLYFERHDGQAVTTDDFVQAMADASGVDLAQFRNWYDEAGTPELEVTDEHDAAARRYVLTVRQSCAGGPPLHIPLAVGLVARDGTALPLRLESEARAAGTTRVLSVTEREQRFAFLEVPEKPLPSLARDFSAPLVVNYAYDLAALMHLMVHDTDPFNRWDAGQRLATMLMLEAIGEVRAGRALQVPEAFVRASRAVLASASEDPAFAAEALTLPAENVLAEQMSTVDPDAIHEVRAGFARTLGGMLMDELLAAYRTHAVEGPYRPDAGAAARRALRNLCLAYLVESGTRQARALAFEQFSTADNMTDCMAALAVLAEFDCDERTRALAMFHERWVDEPLVLDKWLRVQAASRLPHALAEVKRLTAHSAFSLRNPNNVYALIGAFSGNHVRFHSADGSGYGFVADQVIALDRINPQVAARIARAFDRWKKLDPVRQRHACAALERVSATAGLSRDVAEVVSHALE
jgi:aminopeptidase N